MQPLTHEGQEQLRSIAQRYGVSTDAAHSLLESVARGNGTMAQFSHPELGGSGQWMRGGMIMVGDMFNNGLKAMVDGLCNELARLLDSHPFAPAPSPQAPVGGQWQAQGNGGSFGFGAMPSFWPAELGQPTSSGSQNDMRYAYFAGLRRLAIEHNGTVTVYDTLDHQIGGVSQQQGGGYSLSFSSQYGTVDLRQLPITWTNGPSAPAASAQNANAPTSSYGASSPSAGTESEADIFVKIERLAGLRQKGLLSDDEFNAKKAELLARI